jgi:CheY-like chemotaxis protein
MAKPVVLVHNDHAFNAAAVEALGSLGHAIAVYEDSVAALDALEDPHTQADLLITRALFRAGRLNGIALARMMRLKRPTMKLLILGREEFAEHAAGFA